MKPAIQGHSARGYEILQILESLGGKNRANLTGRMSTQYYFINCKGDIDLDLKINLLDYKLYTIEEFEKEFPFKLGDKVIINDSRIGIIEKLIPEHISSYCVKINNASCWCTPTSLRLYKEMKEERNITLTLDKAKEWYKKGGELREIALQAFTEKELNPLPRSWEEFCDNYPVKESEAMIGCDTNIIDCVGIQEKREYEFKDIMPSKKSAEAHLAMMQLEQLRDCWRQGWIPKPGDSCYAIKFGFRDLDTYCFCTVEFLSFPTKEMAEEFLKCFRSLIEKAGDLI